MASGTSQTISMMKCLQLAYEDSVMELTKVDPPRTFEVGVNAVKIKDCAQIRLEPDEQVTFITDSGTQYDVARKEFGYYATPSLNGRLNDQGLRALLAKNPSGRFYILLVETGKEAALTHYLESEQMTIVCWMDSDDALSEIGS